MGDSDRQTRIENALAEFRYRRLTHEAARKYTIELDGESHNVGFFRDTMADVLEELSDAHNIAGIALQRVIRHSWAQEDVHLLHSLTKFLMDVEGLMVTAHEIRESLPSEMQEDNEIVLGDKAPKRIVTLEEVGL